MERRETGYGVPTLGTVAGALDALDDEELRGVIARAQGLLLDRPDPLASCPRLAVEIVEDAEAALLAAYRTLAPSAQRRVRAAVCRLAHETRAPRVAPSTARRGRRR